ncbi:MAG: hypothetical protein K0S40_1896, partial [Actinomycetospora sp.]|nr:hypothetical protein [Actinomycetospora sp.]
MTGDPTGLPTVGAACAAPAVELRGAAVERG